MKVALVHDYIKEYGGAERVLETLHEIYPKAPIYTTVYLPQFLGPHRKRLEKWNIKTSVLNLVPFRAKLISPFRVIAPLIFKSWDFSRFDLVIVSATGAYNPNLIKKGPPAGGQGKFLHICYCHTPPRYLYGYKTAREWKKNPALRVLAEVANHVLRMVDFESAQNVDFFIANSAEVAGRIKKFYRRDSKVIYPPVEIPKVSGINHSRGGEKSYFLAGGRLARPKRVDLAILACKKLNLALKVFGKEFAGYGEELKKLAGPTIEFLGEVTDEEKWKLMKGAKAFIFPSEDEDFGITPVEAQAVGTPVIAYRSGGVVESVVEGKTGVFFDPPSHKAASSAEVATKAESAGRGEPLVDSLVSVIKRFEKMKIKPEDCIAQAKKFSKERFKREIKDFVEAKI